MASHSGDRSNSSPVWQAILETEVIALGKEAFAEGKSQAGHRPLRGEGCPECQMRADGCWSTGRPQHAGWSDVCVCLAAQRALQAEKQILDAQPADFLLGRKRLMAEV